MTGDDLTDAEILDSLGCVVADLKDPWAEFTQRNLIEAYRAGWETGRMDAPPAIDVPVYLRDVTA